MSEYIENAEVLAEIERMMQRTISQTADVPFEEDVATLVALGMGDREAFYAVRTISRRVFGVL